MPLGGFWKPPQSGTQQRFGRAKKRQGLPEFPGSQQQSRVSISNSVVVIAEKINHVAPEALLGESERPKVVPVKFIKKLLTARGRAWDDRSKIHKNWTRAPKQHVPRINVYHHVLLVQESLLKIQYGHSGGPQRLRGPLRRVSDRRNLFVFQDQGILVTRVIGDLCRNKKVLSDDRVENSFIK